MSPIRLLSSRPALLGLVLLAVVPGGRLAAQVETGEWNSPGALELVRRGREARRSVVADSALRSYRAAARGFVYFFLDRNDSDERTLVKTDQVALELFWRAPGDTRQRIVGLRDQKSLPTNIQYHLDHLTVVQDEFGDLIRLGDGDEVAAVVHPVAVGSESLYDFRLADSLTLDFAGARESVRVYKLEVRPRALDRPGFVGSVFLDRATAAIVRMNFTFTPTSYVDPYLDYIRISLDNGLWMGRYWLPYRQEAELRRELPQLDFLAGSVIRGRFEIGDYAFNDTIPDVIFAGHTVLAVPEAQRRAFAFDEPIFADLESEGLTPSPSMEDLTAQVRSIVQDRVLSGLGPRRFYWASVSDGIRYNRAEGLYAGAGASVRLPRGLLMRLHTGWSFGRDDLAARVEWTGARRAPSTRLVAEWRALRDIRPVAGSSGLFNTLASLAGEDWTDPYFVSGVRVEHRIGAPDRLHLVGSLSWEDQRSARLVSGTDAFRAVRPIDDGIVRSLGLSIVAPNRADGFHGRASAAVSRLHGEAWVSAELDAGFEHVASWHDLALAGSLSIGFAGNDPPPQALFLLGGRGTLPGHAHRTQVGDRYWLARTRIGHTLAAPWLGAHLSAAIGQAFIDGPDVLPPGWGGDPDAGVRASAGIGFDLLWEVVSIDLARGIGPGGEWTLMVGVNPRFHPWL